MSAHTSRLLRLAMLLLVSLFLLAPGASAQEGTDALQALEEEVAGLVDEQLPDDYDPALESEAVDESELGDDCAKRVKQAEDAIDEELDLEDDGTRDVATCDEAPAGAVTTPLTQTLAQVLRSGALRSGTVVLRGSGWVKQTLTAGCGAKGRSAKAVLGRATTKRSKAGTVTLAVKPNKAGRAKLRKAKGTLCLRLTTQVKDASRAVKTSTRTVRLQAGRR